MSKAGFVTMFIVCIVASCADKSDSAVDSPAPDRAPVGIYGNLSHQGSAVPNADVKLKAYQDQACVNLGKETKLSPEQEKQIKECSREAANTKTDNSGNFRFTDQRDGFYSLEFSWATNDDPNKSFSMWKPFFMYREGGYLVTFIAAKGDPQYRIIALGEPFQFAGGDTGRRDVSLKKP